MRIRILKALTGVIEGHGLSQFLPGQIYEVSNAFGQQLIAMSAAIEARSTDATVGEDTDLDRLNGGIHVLPPDKAGDPPERRRKRR